MPPQEKVLRSITATPSWISASTSIQSAPTPENRAAGSVAPAGTGMRMMTGTSNTRS